MASVNFKILELIEYSLMLDEAQHYTEVVCDGEGPDIIHEGVSQEGQHFYAIQVGAADRIVVIYSDPKNTAAAFTPLNVGSSLYC